MTITSKFPGKCYRCNGQIVPGERIEWERGKPPLHADLAKCAAMKASLLATPAPAPILLPQLNVKPIHEFLTAARDRGLKSPKLRVLDPAGVSELRITITKSGAAPGSLAVTLSGEYIGAVRPDGTPTMHLTGELWIAHLLKVAADPARAAREYAALMGCCSFCGLPLTDAGSVRVGYGPICAGNWGLPWQREGVPVLGEVR
jgi:hypothetical protein